MTPCELVKSAIHFNTPDALPIVYPTQNINDIHKLKGRFGTEREATGQGLDEWGCVWQRTLDSNMGQVKGHPIGNINEIPQFPFPVITERVFAHFPGEIADARKENKYVRLSYFMLLFERMHSLLGFQTTLEGLYVEPDLMETLADRLADYVIEYIGKAVTAADGDIDGFGFTEDWGTQENTFISLDMWRTFFKPRYKRIFATCHQHRLDVGMHSCGKINDLIEDFIEIGLNSINLQQPRALGVDAISRDFRGKICFEVTCDIQKTLPFGTDEEVEAEAAELLEKWGTPEGGVILVEYGEDSAIGVSPDRGRLMLNSFLKHQNYGDRQN